MTLLEEFVFSLSRVGQSRLRPLQFRGIKKKTWSKLISARDLNKYETIDVEKTLKISINRYYQIQSEILNACFKDLIPEGGIKLLLALSGKHHFRHVYHEMKKQESAIQNNRAALEQYYVQALLLSNLGPPRLIIPSYLHAELEVYVSRYIQVKKPHPDDVIYLRINELRTLYATEYFPIITLKNLIGISQEACFQSEKIAACAEELEQLFDRVKNSDHLLAKCVACDTLAMIYSLDDFPTKCPQEYAKYGKQLVQENLSVFGVLSTFYDTKYTLLLPSQQANTLSEQKEYLNRLSMTVSPFVYVIERIFPQVLQSGDINWAKEYMRNYFPLNLELLPTEVGRSYSVLTMIFHVYNGDYDEGKKYLDKALSFNRGKNQSLPVTCLLRCYDAFFAVILGDDPVSAESTASRHLRYLSQHVVKKSYGKAPLFLKAVRDIMKCVDFDSKKAEVIRSRFLSSCEMQSLTFLFEKIYDKYFVKKINLSMCTKPSRSQQSVSLSELHSYLREYSVPTLTDDGT